MRSLLSCFSCFCDSLPYYDEMPIWQKTFDPSWQWKNGYQSGSYRLPPTWQWKKRPPADLIYAWATPLRISTLYDNCPRQNLHSYEFYIGSLKIWPLPRVRNPAGKGLNAKCYVMQWRMTHDMLRILRYCHRCLETFKSSKDWLQLCRFSKLAIPFQWPMTGTRTETKTRRRKDHQIVNRMMWSTGLKPKSSCIEGVVDQVPVMFSLVYTQSGWSRSSGTPYCWDRNH